MTMKILPQAQIDFITFSLKVPDNKYEQHTMFFHNSDKVFELLLLYQTVAGTYLVRLGGQLTNLY